MHKLFRRHLFSTAPTIRMKAISIMYIFLDSSAPMIALVKLLQYQSCNIVFQLSLTYYVFVALHKIVPSAGCAPGLARRLF